MKLLATVGFSILFSGMVFSQQIDDRLLASYTKSELKEMIKTDKEKYNLLISAIGSAIEVVDFPKGKESKVQNEITLPAGDFNYLDLNLKITDTNQYYRITGTDKLLVVKSFFVLTNGAK